MEKLRHQFEREKNTERPVEPFSVDREAEQWAAILAYEESYTEWLEKQKVLSCRKEVQDFAVAMEKKLRQHDSRPGWQGESFEYLFARMLEEAGEVLTDKAGISGNAPEDEVVDVANFAMMIWDNYKQMRY